jgi:23S rRNA (cytidine1920-2'-O)/16S rRNA (cytidine1409-2'-O)-methyltransferase
VRLDQALFSRGIVTSRSQAESYIKLGLVRVDGVVVKKPAFPVRQEMVCSLDSSQYVSRAALKLASVSDVLQLDFHNKVVLDIGSSTGGFTDYALHHGAKKVIAVDVGTQQLHPKLRNDVRVELHEKTDIRKFTSAIKADMVLADVSFISLRNVLPTITHLLHPHAQLAIMCKPQFEANVDALHKGVVKNSAIRRKILQDFEYWLTSNGFKIVAKADSRVKGEKGNIERFYLLVLF